MHFYIGKKIILVKIVLQATFREGKDRISGQMVAGQKLPAAVNGAAAAGSLG
jgi:hypothetical protein